ncbi:3-hydroxyacyl-CoA dehydrogenase family protein [Alkalihalobacterium chitinilyticum]|uniref:3-hydroxyacyl-CoA dehydrogenase family protein n=1 Tax=Alkalihalobacterium chitinilyticum TaxID=2980103 RepID=A0ABT5VGL3_9BACI|nr:3-hydroxyacyl-CoA dehydrogenase family protein [Alkalihalobacterium chitinilyticum]MDE5413877.1 3-hydroxyacyl-CoA dehydrogenase family protein [Alkalihalobacterium chitinilyticum]
MNVNDIKNITVIGAGSMGHQIAMLCALGGYQTTLQDIQEGALQKAKESLQYQMSKWVSKGKISQEALDQAFARLNVTTSLEEASVNADFVIEAVVEKLDVKRELFEKLDRLTPPHAILATNSSTIVNSSIADVTSRPEKVCNMHFFFPPLVMDCVEVVMSDQTSEETAQITMDVCKQINRTAVLLKKEIWGFVANRLLFALHAEAIKLYEEGICDFKDIDIITKKSLNHPLGPFELMDLSGIDVGYFAQQQHYKETGDPKDKPAKCIEEKVKAGELGRKTGKGWYDYEKAGVKK